MAKILLISLFGIMQITPTSFSQQDIAGNWQTMLKMGPQESRIVLKIYKGYAGAWAGRAYILDPEIQSILMESVNLQNSNITLVWDNGQSRYEGKISADGTSIDGLYTSGVFSFPLKIQRTNKDTAWKTDVGNHRVLFITVDSNVKLEVLDWGGSGKALILLAGMNQDAHTFDYFAPKLVAAGYHVYGITRRGIGESSIPLSGYSADQLGDDVLAVIEALDLKSPVLVGHSLGGSEMSSIGSRYPKKVAGLIYLDAAYIYAYCDNSLSEFFSAVQKYSLEKLKEAEVPTPMLLIPTGWQKYTDIKPPILAIYAEKSVEGNEKIIEAIQRNIPSAKIVILPNAEHNVYRSNEAEVLSEIEAFLGRLP